MRYRLFIIFGLVILMAGVVRAQEPATTTIFVDGNADDWQDHADRIADDVGDAEEGFIDISGGTTFVNQDSLYVLVEFVDPTAPFTQFDVEVRAGDMVYLFGATRNQSTPFKADVTENFTFLTSNTLAAFAFDTVLEIRVSLEELDNISDLEVRSVRAMVGTCCQDEWRASDEWSPGAPVIVDEVDADVLAMDAPLVCDRPEPDQQTLFVPLALLNLPAGYSSDWLVPPSDFNMPQETIVTPQDDLLVVSVRNRRLSSISADGQVQIRVDNFAGGYAADSDDNGNIYIHDMPSGTIYVVNGSGARTLVQSPIFLSSCDSGLVVGPDDNIYVGVADCAGQVDLYQITPAGGVAKVAEGLPYITTMLTTSDGRVLVGTTSNIVQELSLNDFTLSPFATISTALVPSGLAEDDIGNIYVSTGRRDTSGEIFQISADGNETALVANIPDNGITGVEWYGPTGELVGGQLRVGNVLAITPDGNVRTMVAGNGIVTPFMMAFSPCGALAVSNDEGGMMTLVDEVGVSTYFFDFTSFIPPVSYLTYSLDGSLYVAEGAPGFAGRVLRVRAGSTIPEPVAQLEHAAGVVIQPDGTLIVSETPAGRITRINIDGSTETIADGLDFPQGLVTDRSGNIYVITGTSGASLNAVFTSPVDGDRIERITPDGIVTTIATMPALSAIAMGPDGMLYVAAGNQINRVTLDGQVTLLAEGFPGNPDGLVFDLAGNLHVSDSRANGIARIRGFAAGSITGVVMDGDGEPVTDAWVQVVASYPRVVGDVIPVSADGSFSLDVGTRTYTLYVSADGYAMRQLNNVTVGAGQQIDLQINLDGETDEDVFGVESTVSCMITATRVVNLRQMASVASEQVGQMQVGEVRVADGQAIGDDGFVWWRLSVGIWVRSDIVDADGDCEALPTVEP